METNATTTKSFIETQFPVSKLSKESYKERKAVSGQTLTGLGKWWGRKPLVLVRACILGLLMPASDNPKRDREVFLKLMTMDEDGLWRRYVAKGMTLKQTDVYRLLSPADQDQYFVLVTDSKTEVQWKKALSKDDKAEAHRLAFTKLNYDDKLDYCLRPEEISGPSEVAWADINSHLGTSATTLQELVAELGKRRFGRVPRVGDAFCGGGSIPFEAARLGCQAYGSDLNPVATLLTWGAINLVGGGHQVAQRVRKTLSEMFDEVEAQVDEWGIEEHALGWTADAYLYCHDVKDPETGWKVPVAPSWEIAPKLSVYALLVPQLDTRTFEIQVVQNASDDEIARSKSLVTWDDGVRSPVDRNGDWVSPNNRMRTSSDDLRGPTGLRRWSNDDVAPRPEDVFQERLYCIKWRIPTLERLLCAEQVLKSQSRAPGLNMTDEQVAGTLAKVYPLLEEGDRRFCDTARSMSWGAPALAILSAFEAVGEMSDDEEAAPADVLEARREIGRARSLLPAGLRALPEVSSRVSTILFKAPETKDLENEQLARQLAQDLLSNWQAEGLLPSTRIEPGAKTDEPIRTRGFTHWHHLFNPRQLLINGAFAKACLRDDRVESVAGMLLLSRMADYNSRLCRWKASQGSGIGGTISTYDNQALNTLINYGCRTVSTLRSATVAFEPEVFEPAKVALTDARETDAECDLWITDPPYADAVKYDELIEFFLAWTSKLTGRVFPEWYSDSRRALAVQGTGDIFRKSMVECYSKLLECTSDDGLQIVMFTHTNSEVWAELALILWASGMQVVSAWTIVTETDAGKEGNFVQGTVNLILRKREGNRTAWRSDVMPEIQTEVENWLELMTRSNDESVEQGYSGDYSDAEFQLGAYTAALRVLTQYANIEDLNVQKELARLRPQEGVVRERGKEKNPIVELIDEAVRVASEFLVPKGIDKQVWRTLSPMEKLYVKGLEVESHGDYRTGVYMEFARGLGVRDYRGLLAATKANQTRLKTATEFGSRDLRGGDFGDTLLRQVLCAVYKTAQEDDPTPGRNWLRQEVPQYWNLRQNIIGLLQYLAHTPTAAMEHWSKDAAAAELLKGMVQNDSV